MAIFTTVSLIDFYNIEDNNIELADFGKTINSVKEISSFQNFYSSALSYVENFKREIQITTRINKNFGGDYFDRTHLIPYDLRIGNVTGDKVLNFSVFNAYSESKTLNSINKTRAEGLELLNESVPYTLSGLEELEYNLSVNDFGPADINAVFDFVFLTSQDNLELSITGQRISTINYQYESPLNQNIEFLTDIITANNGTETRNKIRDFPIETFDVNYPMNYEELNSFKKNIYGWVDRKWAFPLWSESKIIENISAGDTEINIDTTNFSIFVGALIYLYSSDNKETLEIESITDSVITFTSGVLNSYSKAAIMPARITKINGTPSISTNSFNGSVNLKMETLDKNNIVFDSPSVLYKNKEVFLDELYTDENFVKEEINKRVDVNFFESGSKDFESPWIKSKISKSLYFLKQGLDENFDFLKFVYRMQGRFEEFWIPTYHEDFKLVSTGLITNSFICKNELHTQFAFERKDIYIKLKNDSYILNEITGSSENQDDTETISMLNSIDIDASLIKYISYLDLKRLSNDNVNINWSEGQTLECKLNLVDV